MMASFQAFGPCRTGHESAFPRVLDDSDLGPLILCCEWDIDAAFPAPGLIVLEEVSLTDECRFCIVDMKPQPSPNIGIGSRSLPPASCLLASASWQVGSSDMSDSLLGEPS